MLLVFALQCAWSARLTYQSARRGFLDPRSEDYRWPLVRKALPKLAFTLLDLFFIAFAQNFLLLAAELPQYLLLTRDLASSTHLSALARLKPSHAQVARVPLNVADAVLALAFVVTLVLEMRADNQQQAFQNLKHGALDKQRKGQQLTAKERSAVERGFVAEGLWSWSRHPVRPLCFSSCDSRDAKLTYARGTRQNFACEQTTWYLLYAFTVLPFLALSTSITSHPLSTLTPSILFGGASSTTKEGLGLLSAHLPRYLTLDTALTALLHPLLTLRSLAPELLRPGALAQYAARAKLAGLVALAEVRADEGTHWNYSIAAPLLMSALFFSSTILTERISGSKYPCAPLSLLPPSAPPLPV